MSTRVSARLFFVFLIVCVLWFSLNVAAPYFGKGDFFYGYSISIGIFVPASLLLLFVWHTLFNRRKIDNSSA